MKFLANFKRFGAAKGAVVATALVSGSVMAQDLSADLAAAETEIMGNIGSVQSLMIGVVIAIISVGIVLSLLRRKGG